MVLFFLLHQQKISDAPHASGAIGATRGMLPISKATLRTHVTPKPDSFGLLSSAPSSPPMSPWCQTPCVSSCRRPVPNPWRTDGILPVSPICGVPCFLFYICMFPALTIAVTLFIPPYSALHPLPPATGPWLLPIPHFRAPASVPGMFSSLYPSPGVLPLLYTASFATSNALQLSSSPSRLCTWSFLFCLIETHSLFILNTYLFIPQYWLPVFFTG